MTLEPSTEPSTNSIDARTWTIIIWGLFLGAFVTGGVAAIVGVIIAYMKRADMAGTPFETHIVSAIRTFWISLIAGLIGVVLMIVLIGFLVILASVVWLLFRAVRGLVLAIDSKPIADPGGWL